MALKARARSRQLVAVALLLGCSVALARGGSVQAQLQAPTGNPCLGHVPRLRCPDLVMRRPYDLYYGRVQGRLRLYAGNSIVNVGTGPMELVGRRATRLSMSVTQRIFAVNGSPWDFPTQGHLFFKNIPGLGPYWKFRNAARFELWSLDARGHLAQRVQVGRKLVYCLRDLNKRFSNRYSPAHRHFPGCSQNPDLQRRILGTSVGWSDDYPASYYEQWIDVTGRRGRFAFFQVVDPLNQLHESNEKNNRSPIVYLDLPPRQLGALSGSAPRYLRSDARRGLYVKDSGRARAAARARAGRR